MVSGHFVHSPVAHVTLQQRAIVSCHMAVTIELIGIVHFYYHIRNGLSLHAVLIKDLEAERIHLVRFIQAEILNILSLNGDPILPCGIPPAGAADPSQFQ